MYCVGDCEAHDERVDYAIARTPDGTGGIEMAPEDDAGLGAQDKVWGAWSHVPANPMRCRKGKRCR